jgi:predicted  nucleic acid-binding Zn-ribbon protein
MDEIIKEFFTNQEKIFKAEIEKLQNKINYIEDKIKRINEDFGDIKADLKELKNLQIEHVKLKTNVEIIPLSIKSEIKKEQEEKKYKDFRLWISIIALIISIITLIIKFKG